MTHLDLMSELKIQSAAANDSSTLPLISQLPRRYDTASIEATVNVDNGCLSDPVDVARNTTNWQQVSPRLVEEQNSK
jgi:hypothetical protein